LVVSLDFIDILKVPKCSWVVQIEPHMSFEGENLRNTDDWGVKRLHKLILSKSKALKWDSDWIIEESRGRRASQLKIVYWTYRTRRLNSLAVLLHIQFKDEC
jgi:hypothetical protein